MVVIDVRDSSPGNRAHRPAPSDVGAGMLTVALASTPDTRAAGGQKGVQQTRGIVCSRVTQPLKAVRQLCVLMRRTSRIHEVESSRQPGACLT